MRAPCRLQWQVLGGTSSLPRDLSARLICTFRTLSDLSVRIGPACQVKNRFGIIWMSLVRSSHNREVLNAHVRRRRDMSTIGPEVDHAVHLLAAKGVRDLEVVRLIAPSTLGNQNEVVRSSVRVLHRSDQLPIARVRDGLLRHCEPSGPQRSSQDRPAHDLGGHAVTV